MKNKSIALIIPFFGPLPWYFDYFLLSCKYNPDIDWIIIADDRSYMKVIPANVFMIYKGFEEFTASMQTALGMVISINRPYKICDFRPAFGIIFQNLLKTYDFWGHTDLDVIYGNIRGFITNDILENYEVISMRHDYVAGCMALFKNNEKINTLYQQSHDYKKVFTESKNFCFDETNWCYPNYFGDLQFSEMKNEVESMTHLVKRMEKEQNLKTYFDFHVIEGLPGKMKWKKGKLTYNKKFEAVLYHLIKMKRIFTPPKNNKEVPEMFYISPSRIYT